MELDDEPPHWANRIFAALDFARAGDHARAAAEAKKSLENAAVNDDGRYTIAGVYGLCVKAARSDERLPRRRGMPSRSATPLTPSHYWQNCASKDISKTPVMPNR